MKYLIYIFARGVVSLFQWLPVRSAYNLGLGVGWIAWKLLRGRRLVVYRNLKIVNDWLAAEGREHLQVDLNAQVRRVFLRSGANLLSGFTFARMGAEKAEACLELEGVDVLQEALSEGRGAIILLAHMGPWEALTQLPGLAERHGMRTPFGAMYRPLNNDRLDAWLKGQREAKGTRLFSRNDGFHKPVDFVKGGGMLGILADQKMREGARASYFGVEVPSSPIPGLFQKRSGAAMLSVSIQTISRARWRLVLEAVDLSGLSDKASREDYTSICNGALEEVLSRSVCDGFWFHNRFKGVTVS